MFLITEVRNNHTLVSIDEVSALKKYANWIGRTLQSLRDQNLLIASVTKTLGVKYPLANLIVVCYPMFGNDIGTRTVAYDTIILGNKVLKKQL